MLRKAVRFAKPDFATRYLWIVRDRLHRARTQDRHFFFALDAMHFDAQRSFFAELKRQ